MEAEEARLRKAYFGKPAPSADAFDLILNAGALASDQMVELIETAARSLGLAEQGQVGELAYQYQLNGFDSPIPFFRNPVVLGADTITNYSNSNYNSLQVEARDKEGNHTSSAVPLDVRSGDEQILLRAEKAVYKAGDRIELKVFSTMNPSHTI